MAKGKKAAIELHGSLWLTVKGETFGGANRMALLEKIAQHGSITKGAKACKLSYKTAWDAIDAMNHMAGEPLVERHTGGKGGGGTRLTRRGRQLVENFRMIENEHRHFLNQLKRQAEGIADDFSLIRRMSMKTSARNQFTGKVTSVKRGAVYDEIELVISGGHTIVAVVTHDSTNELGLKLGAEALALVKSSSIIVATEVDGARFSTRNTLTGRVSHLQIGAVNTDVVIELEDGGAVAAVITSDSAASLGLALGSQASALFKAGSVVLGIPS